MSNTLACPQYLKANGNCSDGLIGQSDFSFRGDMLTFHLYPLTIFESLTFQVNLKIDSYLQFKLRLFLVNIGAPS